MKFMPTNGANEQGNLFRKILSTDFNFVYACLFVNKNLIGIYCPSLLFPFNYLERTVGAEIQSKRSSAASLKFLFHFSTKFSSNFNWKVFIFRS